MVFFDDMVMCDVVLVVVNEYVRVYGIFYVFLLFVVFLVEDVVVFGFVFDVLGCWWCSVWLLFKLLG